MQSLARTAQDDRYSVRVGDEVTAYVQSGDSRVHVTGTVTEVLPTGFRVREPHPVNMTTGIRWEQILRHSCKIFTSRTGN